MTDYCTVERDGHVTVVTLNRPEVMNALHYDANVELSAVFDGFASDPDQWVCIVTGAGERAFCAGNDLKAAAAAGATRLPPSGFGGLTHRAGLDKPLIAAVNGLALGGGFEMALACDVIIAARNATFGLPEPRVGMAALGGGLLRLARAVGEKRASHMILTARRVTAEEGERLGFVAEVTPEGEALAAARRCADEMLALSPLSLRASKAVIAQGADEPSLHEALQRQREYPAVSRLLTSDDYREGPRAFAERRPPVWTGH